MTIDWQHLTDEAIGIANLIGIIVGLFRIKDLHLSLNSRLDRMIESEGALQRAQGRAEGMVEGRTAERDRT